MASQTTNQPAVRYGFRMTGPGSAQATLLRHGDGANNIGGGAKNLTQEQMTAYRRARELMQRNRPEDRAAARKLLEQHFEIVNDAQA